MGKAAEVKTISLRRGFLCIAGRLSPAEKSHPASILLLNLTDPRPCSVLDQQIGGGERHRGHPDLLIPERDR